MAIVPFVPLHKGSRIFTVDHHSLQDVQDTVRHIMQTNTEARNRLSSLRGRSSDWFGRSDLTTMGDALRAVHEPWSAGIARFETMRARLMSADVPRPESIRRRRIWSADEGDSVDLDRLRAGQDAWERCVKRQAPGGRQVIEIWVDTTANCTVSAESMQWRGIAGVVLADLLEAAGYRVQFGMISYLREVFTKPMGHLLIKTVLKEADAPVDVQTFINAVSPWFFRTLLFAQCYKASEEIHYGLGFPAPPELYPPEVRASLEPALLSDPFWDATSAEGWIRKVLSMVGTGAL